jgi:4-amino-4-deoxy-L-arabinose transferase-like glycosyltransferase
MSSIRSLSHCHYNPRPMQDLAGFPRISNLRFTFYALLIAAAIFAGVAPTLSWLEFSSGSENLVVGTILDMRHGGPWIIPNLNGQPRTTKPPLTNWISATFVRPESVAALSDATHRDAAYRELSWEIRWPALTFACLSLVAGAWLGRIILGSTAGLAAAAMMGSSAMFLRFGRSMSTDVQLMLWVTTANAFFALAILDRRRWLGCIAGGFALGLALMSKGPVALAQTVAPFATFALWRWWSKRTPDQPRVGWAPILAATAAALLIALPWPLFVLSRMSGQIGFWYREITHAGNVDYQVDPPWAYLSLIALLLPWIAFFFFGCVLLFRERTERGVMALVLLLIPIVIMCCFREKNERYLLPMLAPAAIICATGFLRRGKDSQRAHGVITGITWTILAILAIGLPVIGAVAQRVDGGHWWSKSAAAVMAVGGTALIALAWTCDHTGRRSLIPVSIVIMLSSQALFTYGYRNSDRGRSDGRPIADMIVAALPADAEVWSYFEPGRFSRVPIDMTIYLNRITRQATNPTTLPADGQNRAMLVHFRGDQAVPPGLERWELIGSTPKNEGVWRAYIQRSSAAP